jgi:predicted chitinase
MRIAHDGDIDKIVNDWYRIDGFDDDKISVYRITANNDEKRCPICGVADGLILPAELHTPGFSAPPFHTNCRCDDTWMEVKSLDIFTEWVVPGKEHADRYWIVSANDLIMLGWSGVTHAMVAALNEVQYKYDILTVERVKHFLAQCSQETNKGVWLREGDYVDWSSQSAYENYYNNLRYGYKYRGSGYIQTTWNYNYYSYATYLIVSEHPDIDVSVRYSRNTDEVTLRKLYDNAVEIAAKKGYDIKRYTDVVDIGADYVATNFAWDVAGFWWMASGANDHVDGLKKRTASEADKITDLVNPYESGEARNNRIDYYEEIDKYLGK